MFTLETAATAAYVVAALLFILALAGLSKHETSRSWQHLRHRRHGRRADRHDRPGARPATSSRWASALLVGAMAIGAAIGLWRARVVEMTGMPELIALLHSFVGLAAVLVGWNGYLLVEGDPARRRSRQARRRGPARHPLRRGVHRRLHRRGHLHRVDRGQPQAVGAHQVQPADAAGQELPQRRRAGAVRRAHGVVRDHPAAVAAHRRHRAGAAAGLASGGLDRRRRHARRGVDAQQLLGLGRCRVGLPAVQRPADRDRRARRLLRCLPVLHHVQGDEPVVHLRDRRRLRHRGGPGRGQGLRRAPRDHRRGRRRTARPQPTR